MLLASRSEDALQTKMEGTNDRDEHPLPVAGKKAGVLGSQSFNLLLVHVIGKLCNHISQHFTGRGGCLPSAASFPSYNATMPTFREERPEALNTGRTCAGRTELIHGAVVRVTVSVIVAGGSMHSYHTCFKLHWQTCHFTSWKQMSEYET